MKEKAMKMTLLPPAKDVCQVCATKHSSEEPHNKDSLYYQMQFRQKHERWPTWKDAISHCSKGVKKAIIELLESKNIKWK